MLFAFRNFLLIEKNRYPHLRMKSLSRLKLNTTSTKRFKQKVFKSRNVQHPCPCFFFFFPEFFLLLFIGLFSVSRDVTASSFLRGCSLEMLCVAPSDNSVLSFAIGCFCSASFLCASRFVLSC